MQDNKGWNKNLLKWASSLITGDASSKSKADKTTVSNPTLVLLAKFILLHIL